MNHVFLRSAALSARLSMLALWVEADTRLIDVGTDHGYLPVWLIQNGILKRAAASDLRPLPLAHARATARACGVYESMDFFLSDGLDGVEAGSCDTVVLAGMGGETISAILERAPWTASGGVRLILQPQTKIPELRRWLSERGYAILDESVCLEAGAYYVGMLARGGASEEYGPAELYLGKRLMEKEFEIKRGYFEQLAGRLERAVSGMEASRGGETLRLEKYRRILEDIRKYIVNET